MDVPGRKCNGCSGALTPLPTVFVSGVWAIRSSSTVVTGIRAIRRICIGHGRSGLLVRIVRAGPLIGGLTIPVRLAIILIAYPNSLAFVHVDIVHVCISSVDSIAIEPRVVVIVHIPVDFLVYWFQ
jgi:hypothetical protein